MGKGAIISHVKQLLLSVYYYMYMKGKSVHVHCNHNGSNRINGSDISIPVDRMNFPRAAE